MYLKVISLCKLMFGPSVCTRQKATSFFEWLLSIHKDEPYINLLIAHLAPCTFCISGYLERCNKGIN